MFLTSSPRKLLLTAHLVASVGWFGALLVFFPHAAVSLLSGDEQVVRSLCIAMGLTAWLVILPLSLASLATGIVQAMGTGWGLIRHYWVVAKLLLTVFATAVLVLRLAPISALSEAASATSFSSTSFFELKMSLLVHAFAGLVVLLAILMLAIYKPAGLTPFGDLHGRRRFGYDAPSRAPLPSWVRVSLVIAAAMAVIIVVMMLHGGHGPSMHAHVLG